MARSYYFPWPGRLGIIIPLDGTALKHCVLRETEYIPRDAVQPVSKPSLFCVTIFPTNQPLNKFYEKNHFGIRSLCRPDTIP